MTVINRTTVDDRRAAAGNRLHPVWPTRASPEKTPFTPAADAAPLSAFFPVGARHAAPERSSVPGPDGPVGSGVPDPYGTLGHPLSRTPRERGAGG